MPALDRETVKRLQLRVGVEPTGSLNARTIDAALECLDAVSAFFLRMGVREEPRIANPPTPPKP